MKRDDVWFVYDGDCPLCIMGATHFRIQEAVGNLQLLNAREVTETHPLMQEIMAQKLNLDEGMVLKIGGHLYQGADALHVMALTGSKHGWFNRLNAALFKSETMSRFCYPFMKTARNVILKLKGIAPLNNLKK
jgi:predicted DCC family thiol-disulfide oxidoreductase YuxK